MKAFSFDLVPKTKGFPNVFPSGWKGSNPTDFLREGET